MALRCLMYVFPSQLQKREGIGQNKAATIIVINLFMYPTWGGGAFLKVESGDQVLEIELCTFNPT